MLAWAPLLPYFARLPLRARPSNNNRLQLYSPAAGLFLLEECECTGVESSRESVTYQYRVYIS